MSKSESKYVEEMHMETPDGKLGQGARKHKKRKRLTCKQIIEGIYDKKEGTIFNRTPKDWVLLLLFFLVFYAFLFGYFTLLLFIFIRGILTEGTPFRTGGNSLIGLKSTLSFNPVIDTTNLIDVSTPAKRSAYLDQVDKYMAANLLNSSSGATSCIPGSLPSPLNLSSVCQFNRADLGPCQSSQSMSNDSICVYLRINNVYGWLPDLDNTTTNPNRNILVNCTGKTPADTDNIGQFLFYPDDPSLDPVYGRISTVYYPFLNQASYQPPILAIHFPNLKKNVVISVSCFPTNLKNVNGLAAFSLKIS